MVFTDLCNNNMFKSVIFFANYRTYFAGVEKLDQIIFISIIKANCKLLNVDVNIMNFKEIKNDINVQNVAKLYQIAILFSSTELAKLTLCYIERCFTSVCETNNFLMLDYTIVANILASSELHIDSEVQVLNAADEWVSHNNKERSKFAKQLLLKVRLPLLSDYAIDSILCKSLSFNKAIECVELLRQVKENRNVFYEHKPNKFFSSRYCGQNMFSIIVSGGLQRNKNRTLKVTNSIQQVDSEGFKTVKHLTSMKKERRCHQSVYHRGEIYIFGGLTKFKNNYFLKSIEKYSFITKTWEFVKYMLDERLEFRLCAFMNQIFIVGGCNKQYDSLDSCMKFDTNDKKWKAIAKMNEARTSPGCTVFEGRVVVSGGDIRNNGNGTNSVVEYDHVADNWSYLTTMIERRFGHSSVAIKNKLFFIGSYNDDGIETCEVFDSISRKCMLLKNKPISSAFRLHDYTSSFSIGNKVIILGNCSSTALCYDVDKDEFYEEPFEVTKSRYAFSCTVLPQLEF